MFLEFSHQNYCILVAKAKFIFVRQRRLPLGLDHS
jgi:hypothetical protein